MLKKINISILLLISSLSVSINTNAQTYYGSGYQNVSNNVYYGTSNENINNNSQMRERYYFNGETPQTNNQLNNSNNINNSNNTIYYKKGSKPCWDQAAAYHNVDPWLLMSIAKVESSFDPNAFNGNKNGSYDLGMMQINSIWLPQLKKMGINREMLKDACTSTYIGAWILSQNIRRYGYTWRAIGAYNSGNPKIGYKYALKVYAAHSQLTRKIAMNN